MLACESTTPLGRLVVPDVNWIRAGSRAAGEGGRSAPARRNPFIVSQAAGGRSPRTTTRRSSGSVAPGNAVSTSGQISRRTAMKSMESRRSAMNRSLTSASPS